MLQVTPAQTAQRLETTTQAGTCPLTLRTSISAPVAVLALTGTVVFALLQVHAWGFLHDDTMISLRYAVNFHEHRSLVWNLGEYVEGYTNFLHVILAAGLIEAGVDPILSARLVNATAWAGIVALLLGHPRTLGGREASVVAAVLAGTAAPIVVWVHGGLEAPLLAFLVLALALTTLRGLQGDTRPRLLALAGVLAALAMLTRTDAALFGLASFVALTVAGDLRSAWRRAVPFLVPFLAVMLAHIGWRLSYYGDLLPNTFYAKASGVPWLGWQFPLVYLSDFLVQLPYVPVALAAGLMTRFGRHAFAARVYLAGSVLLYVAYVLKVGGDHMPQLRLFVPTIPLAAVLVALLHAGAGQWRARISYLLTGAVALQLVFAPPWAPRGMDHAAAVGLAVGDYIQQAWPAGSVIATNSAGALAYRNLDKGFIDMLGLNDRIIARTEVREITTSWQHIPGHGKGNGAYVLDRAPDYIILRGARGDEDLPPFLSDQQIEADPRFAACYRAQTVQIPIGPDHPAMVRSTDERTIRFNFFARAPSPQCETAERAIARLN